MINPFILFILNIPAAKQQDQEITCMCVFDGWFAIRMSDRKHGVGLAASAWFWMKHGVLARLCSPTSPCQISPRGWSSPKWRMLSLTCPVGNICRSAPNPKAKCHFRKIGAKRLELWRENCIQKLHCRFLRGKRKVLAVNPYFSRREPVFYP